MTDELNNNPHKEIPEELAREVALESDFFMSTFGELIRHNLRLRAEYDVQYQHTVQKDPFRLEITTTGKVVYGTGERTFALNLYGRKLTFWNTDAGSYDRGLEPINYTIPFLILVESQGVRGIFVDNTYHGTVDIGLSDPNKIIFEFDGKNPYFGESVLHEWHCQTIEEAVSHFTDLTGRMSLPPLWSLGHQQCRYSYMNQDEVIQIAKALRAKNIPSDVIYLDIHYMDNYKVFTWDKQAFPDFKGMIAQLHAMNFKLVTILDPGVKVEKGYTGYETGLAENIFITYPDGKPAEGIVWPGLTHHPDFTNPKARTWWANQLKDLLEAGVDGIWNDMNEPLYFGDAETISPSDYVVHDNEGKGGTHAQLHNVYGMNMSKASLQALETHRPHKRPFNMTRSGYAGTQQYASSWTGDNKSTWDDLRLSIPMNLNMGLAGQSFTGPDIGGFSTDTESELLVRWYQCCVLFPFFRNHSAVDTIRQEPWVFGEEVENMIRQTIELRYRLMPYLYTTFAECHFDGTPIMRPLFTAESDNPHLTNVDDSYLVGEKILVAPILEKYALRRTVYLPKGEGWYLLKSTYDFSQYEYYTGGQLVNVEAPLDTTPIFIKAGTVLPTWQLQQSVATPSKEVILEVFAGNGVTRLYEDSGEGLAYQDGDYRWTTFTSTQENNQSVVSYQSEGKLSDAPKHIFGKDITVIEES